MSNSGSSLINIESMAKVFIESFCPDKCEFISKLIITRNELFRIRFFSHCYIEMNTFMNINNINDINDGRIELIFDAILNQIINDIDSTTFPNKDITFLESFKPGFMFIRLLNYK